MLPDAMFTCVHACPVCLRVGDGGAAPNGGVHRCEREPCAQHAGASVKKVTGGAPPYTPRTGDTSISKGSPLRTPYRRGGSSKVAGYQM